MEEEALLFKTIVQDIILQDIRASAGHAGQVSWCLQNHLQTQPRATILVLQNKKYTSSLHGLCSRLTCCIVYIITHTNSLPPLPHKKHTQFSISFSLFPLSHTHLSNVTGLNTGRSVVYFYHILVRNQGSCLQIYGHRTHILYPHTQAHAHTHTYIYHHKVNTERTVVYTGIITINREERKSQQDKIALFSIFIVNTNCNYFTECSNTLLFHL